MDYSDRRTSSYRDALAVRALSQRVAPGASSYFTAPERELDPNLFAGDKMRPVVRTWIQSTVRDFLTNAGYFGVRDWLHIWVAGSGASYQWSAARDPGDLDVLLGIEYELFRQTNVRYNGLSDKEIGDDLNEQMQADLWKRTANQAIGGGTYEVTWYCNPKSTDIRAIHPYAAYDVDHGEWTVRPIDLPAAGPGEWFPKEYDIAAHADQLRAVEIVTAYNRALSALHDATNRGSETNAKAQLAQATRDGETLFEEIHQGRHEAFDDQGEGYRDYANYRWQRGKQLGTIPALRAIHDEAKAAREETERALYGARLKSTAHVRVQAALGRIQ